MENQGFAKLNRSDRKLYGPRKVLLSGFTADSQKKFISLLRLLNLSDLPLVWVGTEHANKTLQDLCLFPDGSGSEEDSELPRAIVVSGISENELHLLMSGAQKAGMRGALWATLTPTTEAWSFDRLIAELRAERDALSNR